MGKKRCKNCRKKALFLFECKCKMKLCISCNNVESHKCTFDYKKEHMDKLLKENPTINFKKVDKV